MLSSLERYALDLETLIASRQLVPHVVPVTITIGAGGPQQATSMVDLMAALSGRVATSIAPAVPASAEAQSHAPAVSSINHLRPSQSAVPVSQIQPASNAVVVASSTSAASRQVQSFSTSGVSLDSTNVALDGRGLRKVTKNDVLRVGDHVWIYDASVGYVEATYQNSTARKCTVQLGSRLLTGTRAAVYVRQSVVSEPSGQQTSTRRGPPRRATSNNTTASVQVSTIQVPVGPRQIARIVPDDDAGHICV
jgi:hypothetical protein